MRSGLVQSLVRQLRRSAKEAGPRRTDADLVHRFAAEHDSEAFAELVQRHGPLVWGVCRRSVANRADAEDAFQATFLVFARNARSIRKPEALGAWLHGVAYRVARRMRSRGESLPADPHSSAPSCLESLTLREFLAALDDELAALPDKYRGPLVLCFLQERTQDDAARRLGVSLSTLKRRLEMGRELLRGRLTRRGVELPAVLLAAGLGGALPAALAEGAVRAATVGVAGVVSANVLTITEGVTQAMWETKLRAWVVGILVATAAAGGTSYFAYTGQAQTETGKQPANKPAEKKPDPNERLRAAELDAAKAEVLIAEAALVREVKNLDRLKALAQSGVVAATELAQAESKADEAKAQLLRAKAQYDVAAARVEAERLKAAVEADRFDEDKRARLDRYERAFTTQSIQPELQRLKQEMLISANDTLAGVTDRHRTGSTAAKATHHDVYQWSKRVMELEQELTPANRVNAIKAHYTRMRKVEDVVQENGNSTATDRAGVHVYRLEAEIWAKQAEAGVGRPLDSRLEFSRTYDRGSLDSEKSRTADVVDQYAAERTKVQTDDLTKRLTQLEAEVRASRDEAAKLRDIATIERQRAEQLAKRVEELTDLLKSREVPAPNMPEGFRGTVKAIDGELLTITPGADAGVRKGVVLEVVRAGNPQKVLGTLTILSAEPKEAIGRFMPDKAKPPADELPKKGDLLRAAK